MSEEASAHINQVKRVQGMCLMSKAPRTVIRPYLTVALTIAQALPTEDTDYRDTIYNPSPKCMRSWPSEPSTINLCESTRL